MFARLVFSISIRHQFIKEVTALQNFLKSRKFKIILVLFAFAVAVILRAAAEGGFGSTTAQIIGSVTSPLLKISSSFTSKISSFFEKITNVNEIYELNSIYRDKINDLNAKLIDYENIKRENEQYKTFLELKKENSDFKFAPASVIAKDPNDRFGSFVIDRGENDGIKINDPVISSDGIVGVISSVGPTYSSVVSILDPSVKLGCYCVQTFEYGVCEGDIKLALDGMCKFIYLPRDSVSRIGDLVVSSGGGIFPRGLVIGNISSIQPEDHGVSLYASVTLSADINNITEVFVITEFEGQGNVLADENLLRYGNYNDSREK